MVIARKTLALLEQHLHEHAGLELPGWIVQSRVRARMSSLGLDADAYVGLVTSRRGAAERDSLVEALRVGETRFFRHRPQVDAVLEVVIPAWRARRTKNPRVWSAGCATGEEPYTLALVLARALAPAIFAPTIYATDVSAEAIVVAQRATYCEAALDHVPEAFRDGLVVDGASVRVRRDIARLVTFEQKNLADPGQPRGFDLVWCRNVLIYFGPTARRRVLEELVESLAPGGFLFLGYSETLRDIPGLTAVRWNDQVLWEKTASAAPFARASTRSASMRSAPMIPSGDDSGVGHGEPLVARERGPSAVPPSAKKSTPEAVVRFSTGDLAALASEIRNALRARGLSRLTVDLDDAEFIDDDVAPVLHRAVVLAEARDIVLELRATRPGAQRWLRRNRLRGGEP